MDKQLIKRISSPILNKHCTHCHQADDIGPIPLTTYDEVASYASMIKFVTDTKLMPPFKADRHKTSYQNERHISEQEKETIANWIEIGLLEGDPDSPQLTYLNEPFIEYDTSICMQESFEHYGIYYDQYQVFVLPTAFEKGQFIKDIYFEPGNKKIVRSAQLSIATKGASESMDQWDPRYGYFAYGSLGFTPSHPNWYAWMPNTNGQVLNDDRLYVPPESELLMHIHYGPFGEVQKDSSCVHINFDENANSSDLLQNVPFFHTAFLEEAFFIDAGLKKRVSSFFELPSEATLRSITPLAHLLCRNWEVFAVLPDRTSIPLLSIEDWDFHWKEKYIFKEPILLPSGTKIYASASYDNTADNPYNPASPPHAMKRGPHMYDENFVCFFEFVGSKSSTYIKKPFTSTEDSIDELAFYINQEGRYKIAITELGNETSEELIRDFPIGQHTIKSSVLPNNKGRYSISIGLNNVILDTWWLVVF